AMREIKTSERKYGEALGAMGKILPKDLHAAFKAALGSPGVAQSPSVTRFPREKFLTRVISFGSRKPSPVSSPRAEGVGTPPSSPSPIPEKKPSLGSASLPQSFYDNGEPKTEQPLTSRRPSPPESGSAQRKAHKKKGPTK